MTVSLPVRGPGPRGADRLGPTAAGQGRSAWLRPLLVLGGLGLVAGAAVLIAHWFFDRHLHWLPFGSYGLGAGYISWRLMRYLRQRRHHAQEGEAAWRLRFETASEAVFGVPFLLIPGLGLEQGGLVFGAALAASEALGRLANGPPRGGEPQI